MPTKATVKSSVEKTRYTPSAYHPYDFTRCLSRCETVASGGKEDVFSLGRDGPVDGEVRRGADVR